MGDHFMSVTELSGADVSAEQIHRMCSRYYWAGQYCKDKTVLELACGTGQGLSYLYELCSELSAGDISPAMVNMANSHHQNIKIMVLDALSLGFETHSLDVVILYEALYYLPDFGKCLLEVKRVLKPGGKLLLATANPDLYDFNPSPYSHKYYGVVDLTAVLSKNGFQAKFFGDFPISEVSLKQKLIRPIKKIMVSLGLVPKTMAGKKLLKRLIFGKLASMPAKITKELVNNFSYQYAAIASDKPDTKHKVILCEATIV